MTATATDAQRADRRAWAALAVLVLPVLLISVDMTVLSFAVPHLSEAMSPTGPELLWIVDIYGFMIAGLLVTMGTLGDRIGRRRLLLIGATAFGAASALAVAASEPAVLIAARALLGAAGATLMPSTLSLIRNVFLDTRQRNLAIAIWGTMFAAGNVLGPLVGGWMLAHFWWGSVFLINLPVMAVLLVLTPLLVPESRDPHPGRYDLVSAGMSLVAMLLAVYGIKNMATGGRDPVALAALAAGIAVGVAFVRRQRRLPVPLLNLGLFGNRAFSGSVVTNLLMTLAFVGALFFVTQYLQIVRGLEPLTAGLVLVPGLALGIVTGLVTVPLMRRFSAAWLLFAALMTVAMGYLLMTQADRAAVPVIVVAFLLVGGGVGVVQTLTNNIIMSAVDPAKAGGAAAVSETAYEVGSGMGTALLGSVLTGVYAARLGTVDGISDDALGRARETLGGAVVVADEIGGQHGDNLLAAADSAFTTAMHVTSVTAAVVVVLAAMQGLVLLRRSS